uniref:Uncharacterized protein n=1 Tax=uncultured euryarchaeote Alv-FOS1 TaxID=337892 RepID=Q3SAC8_9EURY|nr:hypothetical protein [uncultured euryarchaeote Alv-FOS1]
MTTIRDSIKMGESISIPRTADGKELEIYYNDSENMWYLATLDRDEFVLIGNDEDLENLYDLLKHVVENEPWEDDWELEDNES